jgi:Do/DeqQ family serine protease
MKSPSLSCIAVATLAIGAAGLFIAAKDVVPKAVLHIDSTPVSEGKSPIVTSYADVIDPVKQAVVSVYSTKIVRERLPVNPLFHQFFGDEAAPERESEQHGLGSGVIVSSDGYILTNNHVVEGADELNVLLPEPDNRKFKAKVIGTDPKTDIAVIKIDAEHLPSAILADSDKLRVGDVVFAIGNPLNVGQTVTMGIVSATGRKNLGLLDNENIGGYDDFIQTDAAINMGNSGGALVDAKGRVIGINSAIISTSEGNIGIGFSIPINLAANIMQSLIGTGKVTRGFLGVNTDALTAEIAEQLGVSKDTRGVVITDVKPDSPAAKAGLKRSDIILALNDKAVESLEDLRLLISETAPGTEVAIKFVHEGKEQTIKVILGTLSDEIADNELLPGVTVAKLTDDKRRELNIDDRVAGLLITNVEDNSPYSDKLASGAVIIEIDRVPVTTVEAAKGMLTSGRHLFLIYFHGIFGFQLIDVK